MGYLYIGNKKFSPIITSDYESINVSGATPTIALDNYKLYNAGTLTSLTITNPNPIPTDFIAQINFISGNTPTVINGDIEWYGDNVNENVGFKPRANCQYSIMFYYSNNKVRGIIQGSSL